MYWNSLKFFDQDFFLYKLWEFDQHRQSENTCDKISKNMSIRSGKTIAKMGRVMILVLLVLSTNPTNVTMEIVVPNRGIVPPSQPSHCTYIPGNKTGPPCHNNPVIGMLFTYTTSNYPFFFYFFLLLKILVSATILLSIFLIINYNSQYINQLKEDNNSFINC